MFVRRTLGCACDGMLDPRGAARPSTESPGGCYVTARHDVATVGESLTGLSERSARHVLVGRGIVKSLKRSGCAAVSRTHKTKSLCDRSGLQTALLVTLTALGVTLTVPSLAQAEQGKCPNEQIRTGRSAGLPDCRAYELVTPAELGRTVDMAFTLGQDRAVVAGDGEALALEAKGAFLEPGSSLSGTLAVFSRTASGWGMRSVTTPAMTEEGGAIESLSPDFSQVGFGLGNPLDLAGSGELAFGPVGGPYSTVSIPGLETNVTNVSRLVGANAGTSAVPPFSDVLFISTDHALLAPGVERERAEETAPGDYDLYEWSGGQLRLVDLDGEGALLNRCGATLGQLNENSGAALDAVSANGARVFFTSPEFPGVSGCPEPALYMRVEGRETVDVSEPEGVSVPPAARQEVGFDGASADGSKVFFTTATSLTPEAGPGYHLYEYNVEAPAGHRLTLIADKVGRPLQWIDPSVVVSGDGAVVYYKAPGGIYRYESVTGRHSFVATPRPTQGAEEPMYTTPDGGFLVFPSGAENGLGPLVPGPHGYPELVEESRGAAHDELYRYDGEDGDVICVSCGEGVAPAKGNMTIPKDTYGLLYTIDGQRVPISISNDGERVFFQTNQRLVAQDMNESSAEEESTSELGVGGDTYEWEAPGVEEGPDEYCRVAVGCTHLISAGEDVGSENFLGASESGDDVFFVSAAQLVPGATPEFANLYDARVDGGFPSPAASPECTSCQGVGSPPPAFGAPASETLAGAGNPVEPVIKEKPKPKKPKKPSKPRGRGRRGARGKKRRGR